MIVRNQKWVELLFEGEEDLKQIYLYLLTVHRQLRHLYEQCSDSIEPWFRFTTMWAILVKAMATPDQ